MKEPSILDYLKSRLNPWQKEKIEIPEMDISVRPEETVSPEETPADTAVSEPTGMGINAPVVSVTSENGMREINIKLRVPTHVPWRSFLGLALALFAQWMMEPSSSSRPVPLATGFYFFALVFLVWAYVVNEFALPVSDDTEPQIDPQTFRPRMLFFAVVLAMVAFATFSDNLFTWLNVSLWLAALALFVGALWLRGPEKESVLRRAWDFFKQDPWQVSITRWAILNLSMTCG